MSSSKHPLPSAPVFPQPAASRGRKLFSPHCVSLFPHPFLSSMECGSGAFYPPFRFSFLMFRDAEFQVSKICAGKHWLELPRVYVAVVHSQNIIYTKYRIHFPYVLTGACFRSAPFVQTRNESHLPVSRIQNL